MNTWTLILLVVMSVWIVVVTPMAYLIGKAVGWSERGRRHFDG